MDTIELLLSHRSIRKFKSDPIDNNTLNRIFECGSRASSAGNMQTWSVIVTEDLSIKDRLYNIHLKQEMILQAPIVLTFCADFYRMKTWQRNNAAKESFDDLAGFMTATIDTIIAAQNMAIASESLGLGICYLGTTLWAADKISKLFKLPDYVIPVTSMVVGYPDEQPHSKPRLPLSSLIHREEYQQMDGETLNSIYREKEEIWQARVKADSLFTGELLDNNIQNLAQFYSSYLKYGKPLHASSSKILLKLLQDKGFWNF